MDGASDQKNHHVAACCMSLADGKLAFVSALKKPGYDWEGFHVLSPFGGNPQQISSARVESWVDITYGSKMCQTTGLSPPGYRPYVGWCGQASKNHAFHQLKMQSQLERMSMIFAAQGQKLAKSCRRSCYQGSEEMSHSLKLLQISSHLSQNLKLPCKIMQQKVTRRRQTIIKVYIYIYVII